MTAAVLLNLSPTVAGHLAVAIDGHRRWAARVGMLLPPELAELQAAMTAAAARGRQDATPLEDLAELRDRPAVPPLLLSYEDAAAALCLSVRSVQRLVAAGELRSVQLGGSVRIAVAELTRFVGALAQEEDVA